MYSSEYTTAAVGNPESSPENIIESPPAPTPKKRPSRFIFENSAASVGDSIFIAATNAKSDGTTARTERDSAAETDSAVRAGRISADTAAYAVSAIKNAPHVFFFVLISLPSLIRI